jgi:starch synthase
MHVLHVSTECYPVAKVGGLGDVVGALPKFQGASGIQASVIIPKYDTPQVRYYSSELNHSGKIDLAGRTVDYQVFRLVDDALAFALYVVDLPGLFDRPGIYLDTATGYPYGDEFHRYLSFQLAVLDWIQSRPEQPDILHCHDHHTGWIPFFMTSCDDFADLARIPTMFTIHNGMYQGIYPWEHHRYLPAFTWDKVGLLDWDGNLNAMATALKCCWVYNTVSKQYLTELSHYCMGLEPLFQLEHLKGMGILNGIDTQLWDPKTDPFINHHYTKTSVDKKRAGNREDLLNKFYLDPKLPIISFIGRLVPEKGADLVAELVSLLMVKDLQVNILVLGTGDPALQRRFLQLKEIMPGRFDCSLEYNESLSHLLYAGSDFLLMPSKVEPCGLNQLYAMRYGAIPIVRTTGGLKDTVVDIDEKGGYGICFEEYEVQHLMAAVKRAKALYDQPNTYQALQKKVMGLNFSWDRSAATYAQVYHDLLGRGSDQ